MFKLLFLPNFLTLVSGKSLKGYFSLVDFDFLVGFLLLLIEPQLHTLGSNNRYHANNLYSSL